MSPRNDEQCRLCVLAMTVVYGAPHNDEVNCCFATLAAGTPHTPQAEHYLLSPYLKNIVFFL